MYMLIGQRTVQFTPLVLEHTLLSSHLLWGEFKIFGENSNFLHFAAAIGIITI